MNIYERLGKTIEERDAETEAHIRTLHLLRRLQRGDLALGDVYMTDNGWTLTTPGDNGAELRRPQVVGVSSQSEGSADE